MNLPPLRMPVLLGLAELKDQVTADPDFLDSDKVTYDGDTLALLKKILAPTVITQTIEKEVIKRERGRPSKDMVLSQEDQQLVRDEFRKLLDELNKMGGDTATEALDVREKLAIIKTKSTLTENVLKMQERALNIKKQSEFMETVMGILEELVDEKGREQFLKRLEPFR